MPPTMMLSAGVLAPEPPEPPDPVSKLAVLLLPSNDEIDDLFTLKRCPLPLNLRIAEKALAIVPTEESVWTDMLGARVLVAR